MAVENLTVMGIHGLGDHRAREWIPHWESAIRDCLEDDGAVAVDFVPFEYDKLFERIDLTAAEQARAVAKLLQSGALNYIGGLFGRQRRGLFDTVTGWFDKADHWLRWYAGYVVAWVEDEDFRSEVRGHLYKAVADHKPDLILAHSLGSLISYDAFADRRQLRRRKSVAKALSDATYVTLGSQIANPFVVGNLTSGRIVPLPVEQWLHLYNREDSVFTAPIRMPGVGNFMQVLTPFGGESTSDRHSAVRYIRHGATRSALWTPLQWRLSSARGERRAWAAYRGGTPQSAEREPRKRAVLVGIDEYADPRNRLQGCENDVFLMSSVLQECGFDASGIRVVLNDRATATGILERMDWLLDDARDGDQLVFFYSGHGAQLADYDPQETGVDRQTETLVPYDFDWSPETSITDDAICSLYSQLPYGCYLVMVFDCCHSGGIHRDGAASIRGLSPPDDIRHRSLRWDAVSSMWVPRDLPLLPVFADDEEQAEKWAGRTGNVLRLGRGMPLRDRSLTPDRYKKLRRTRLREGEPYGPYLPIILEACGETEYAYEYRHGSQSYGAFTYALSGVLRERKRISFDELVEATSRRLRRVGYDQQPAILGPTERLKMEIPWMSANSRKKRRKKR